MLSECTKAYKAWHGKAYGRPFAYSTRAESEFIEMLAEMGYSPVRALTNGRFVIPSSCKEREILQAFIDEGHGHTPLRDLGIKPC